MPPQCQLLPCLHYTTLFANITQVLGIPPPARNCAESKCCLYFLYFRSRNSTHYKVHHVTLSNGINSVSFINTTDSSALLIGRNDFSFQFRKIQRIGYNLNLMRQSACLVLTHPWLITTLPSLIACRSVGCQSL